MSSSAATTETRLVTLRTSDGKTFLVNEAVAASKFGFIKQLVDDGCAGGVISVPRSDSRLMVKMLEWCKKHADEKTTSKELKAWDAKFVNNMDQAFIYRLMLAADYLNATELVDLLIQKVVNMIKGKKAEEIRQIFQIKNDFTPEQEKEIRQKNAWAFD